MAFVTVDSCAVVTVAAPAVPPELRTVHSRDVHLLSRPRPGQRPSHVRVTRQEAQADRLAPRRSRTSARPASAITVPVCVSSPPPSQRADVVCSRPPPRQCTLHGRGPVRPPGAPGARAPGAGWWPSADRGEGKPGWRRHAKPSTGRARADPGAVGGSLGQTRTRRRDSRERRRVHLENPSLQQSQKGKCPLGISCYQTEK